MFNGQCSFTRYSTRRFNPKPSRAWKPAPRRPAMVRVRARKRFTHGSRVFAPGDIGDIRADCLARLNAWVEVLADEPYRPPAVEPAAQTKVSPPKSHSAPPKPSKHRLRGAF